MNSEIIVTCARSWVGTRFAHQGRRKQNGQDKGAVDCLGLLIGVAEELQLERNGKRLSECDERDYGHLPDENKLMTSLVAHLQPIEKSGMIAGNVLLLEVDGKAQHLALVSDYEAGGFGMVHAYAPARKVVEHVLDASWMNRIRAVFRF